jgi:hypothetical protein
LVLRIYRRGARIQEVDFYVVEPGAVYAQKSAPGTEILFIKVPPGNDKVPVEGDWLAFPFFWRKNYGLMNGPKKRSFFGTIVYWRNPGRLAFRTKFGCVLAVSR